MGPVSAVRSWTRLRRPAGLVDQTRLLFFLTSPLCLLVVLPEPLTLATPTTLPLLLVGAPCLLAVWCYRYLTGSSAVLLDVVEAAAAAAFAATAANPAIALSFVTAANWSRALYGSTPRFVLSRVFAAAGLAASLPLWVLVQPAATDTSSTVLRGIPVMLLTAAVARYLARSLIAREQAQHRDAALVRLGDRLIGLGDEPTIHRRAAECAAALVAATPGLRSLVALPAGAGHRVIDQLGGFPHELTELRPGTLPARSVDTRSADTEVRPVADPRVFAAAAGIRGEWLAVPLADVPGGWIVLGAPRRVPAEAVVAFQSMTNQVALALRTSAAHDELAARAHIDVLTGLANRAAFNRALDQGLRDPDRQPALMFLDLDDFKVVNDGLGHAAGDELLGHVAARLRAAVRPHDLCARLGGDEFAVLVTDAATVDEVAGVAQRLVDLVAAPASLQAGPAQVGGSVGVAFATAGTTAAQLMQHADIAMYAAKAKGKNRVQVFDPGLLREDGRAVFEAELAAAAGAGQLVVHYQPIVSVADGSCVAAEALVRWQHPTRGLLAPAEFIPDAERTGAIVGIGTFVLRRACADAAPWRRTHDQLSVHVNVSAAQLTAPGFRETVRSCLADHDIPPRFLVLEITESMVLDSAAIRTVLDELIALGVELAIDDFGTGYSALTTLRTLPLTVVKIDKSFLEGGRDRAADEAVVQAIVQMAGRLGLRIVAEGVERVDQQEFLESVGADAAQGYLHLRPTAAPEFGVWLDRRAPQRPPSTVTPLVRPA